MPSDSAVHALAGALGGATSMAFTYPLITISTRAAVESKKPGHARESTLTAVRRVIAQEGISGLFDGLESSLAAISVTNAAFYFFFEESRAVILRRKNAQSPKIISALSTLESILASFIAGCATSIVTNPMWVINTNQISQATIDDPDASVQTKRDPKTGETKIVKKLSFMQTLRKIYKRDGLAGFFRGLGPALLLVINPIIAYTAFEQLKNVIIARRAGAAQTRAVSEGITAKPAIAGLSDLDNFLLGAFTKLLATGSTYPYLVVKSRLQAGAAQSKRYKNAFHALALIVKEEGIGALYSGISSKLMQSMLTAAFLFASKERIYLATKAAIRATAKAVPS